MGDNLLLGKNGCISLVAILLTLTFIVGFSGSCTTESSGLYIFAAAGSKPAVDEICRQFQDAYDIKVEVTYGGGGEVLSQMTLAKSGDLYIAPEQGFMEKAIEKQAIDPDTVNSVAYMIPVIAVPQGNPGNIQTLADLARPGIKLAVTRPETTLLGKYAPEIFAKAGLTEEISRNIVTEAARPDNLLTMLVMGQVDAGILWHFYAAQNADKIENIYLLPGQLTGIGEIQIAVTTYCRDKDKAGGFVDFITSSEGKAVFEQLGYLVDAEKIEKYWQ
jgi:molybdate transport system substrate-binding protein